MVNNAKSYNEKSSIVYADAERIRKALSNFMTKHNPAYLDPEYIAFPTPLPGEEEGNVGETGINGRVVNMDKPRPIGSIEPDLAPQSLNGRGSSTTPSINDGHATTDGFEGESFQSAQEKIIAELVGLKNAK